MHPADLRKLVGFSTSSLLGLLVASLAFSAMTGPVRAGDNSWCHPMLLWRPIKHRVTVHCEASWDAPGRSSRRKSTKALSAGRIWRRLG